MSSLVSIAPEAFPWGCAQRHEDGWEHPRASGDQEFAQNPVRLPLDCGADPRVRPYLSVKCSDSHPMKVFGCKLCFC